MITTPGVKGMIGQALTHASPMSAGLSALASIMPTSLIENQSEEIDWLGAVPALKEWGEGRQNSATPAYDWTIQNKKFESSMNWPKNWQEEDKTGQIQQRISQLSARYRQWWEARIAYLINNGESLRCFTAAGEYFYANSHSWGDSGTTDNLLAYSMAGSTPTAQEMADAILAAIVALLGFKDDKGEPLNETMTQVTVAGPIAYGSQIMQAVKSDRLDTGSGTVDNPLKGLDINVNYVATPRITLSSRITVTNTTPGEKAAFVGTENVNLRRITSKAEGSDYAFDTGRYAYGIECVGNAGYGLFGHSCLTVFS